MNMDLTLEIATAVLLLVGSFFTLVGAIGLVRLPDFFMRLHGPTKATTLGVGGMLLASIVNSLTHELALHELLITLFLFLTAPITANMIAKAHLHRQGRAIDPNPMDDIAEGLPETGVGTGWATFEGQAADRADPPR